MSDELLGSDLDDDDDMELLGAGEAAARAKDLEEAGRVVSRVVDIGYKKRALAKVQAFIKALPAPQEAQGVKARALAKVQAFVKSRTAAAPRDTPQKRKVAQMSESKNTEKTSCTVLSALRAPNTHTALTAESVRMLL
eukprot:g1454.t1